MSAIVGNAPKFWVQERVAANQITPTVVERITQITMGAFYSSPTPWELVGNALTLIEDLQNTAFFCWEGKGKRRYLVGYAVAEPKPEYLFVNLLAVDQNAHYQRKGLGTLLMQRIFERSLQKKALVTLNYNCFERPLRRFYDKFEPINKGDHNFFQLLLNPVAGKPIFDPKISSRAIRRRENLLAEQARICADVTAATTKAGFCVIL